MTPAVLQRRQHRTSSVTAHRTMNRLVEVMDLLENGFSLLIHFIWILRSRRKRLGYFEDIIQDVLTHLAEVITVRNDSDVVARLVKSDVATITEDDGVVNGTVVLATNITNSIRFVALLVTFHFLIGVLLLDIRLIDLEQLVGVLLEIRIQTLFFSLKLNKKRSITYQQIKLIQGDTILGFDLG